MEYLDWGANEISLMQMEYQEQTQIAHFLWEGDRRRIDIEFETFEISEQNDSA